VTPTRLSAIADHLVVLDGPGIPVPGISAVPAPGHTPGSTVYVASEGTARVVFLGDVVHCPVQLLDAEWAVLGDVDPRLAARTRERVVRELEGADVAGAHFPGLALGRLIRSEVARRWTV
jgi:glyoxylase-like metal-dependent hydrolase (beta-lactamase superfamily II)